MKKFILLPLIMFFSVAASGAITAAQKYKLNHMNSTAYDVGLGTLINDCGVPNADEVTSAMIVDGTIAAGDIGSSAVTSAKILDGTIAAADLGTSAVTSDKILDGAIVNADVNASAAIAYSKLSLTGSLVTADLGDSAVTEAKLAAYGSDGRNVKRIARATFDITGNSAVNGSSTVNSGLHSLGVTLPGKSIITDSYFYVVEQVASGANGTVAFQCEDANNIFTATDITGQSAGVIYSGANYGADSSGAANMTGAIANDCTISAQVGTADLSAGKLILFVEYVIAE